MVGSAPTTLLCFTMGNGQPHYIITNRGCSLLESCLAKVGIASINWEHMQIVILTAGESLHHNDAPTEIDGTGSDVGSTQQLLKGDNKHNKPAGDDNGTKQGAAKVPKLLDINMTRSFKVHPRVAAEITPRMILLGYKLKLTMEHLKVKKKTSLASKTCVGMHLCVANASTTRTVPKITRPPRILTTTMRQWT